MLEMSPKQVVEAYNLELWNKKNYQLGAEIIADTVVRYYPGSSQTMTRAEALQRVKDVYSNTFETCEFKLTHLFAEGEYVTLVWEMFAVTKDGEDFVHSNIEIFRVVNGQICEFWNPENTGQPNDVWGKACQN